jgi:hypothetical protein
MPIPHVPAWTPHHLRGRAPCVAPGILIHFGNHNAIPLCGTWARMRSPRGALVASETNRPSTTAFNREPLGSQCCSCGSPICRGVVSSADRRLPELQGAIPLRLGSGPGGSDCSPMRLPQYGSG